MGKGSIGVTSDNIFPIIKKFLYSDHEIFLRELVSNAMDATQKLKTMASVGDFKGEMGDLTVRVSVDKEAKTLTVSDRGIGMTADEIEKYINQIAFSGAEEFVNKYKDNAQAIIGHFGLGFYSAFMVSKQVEIITRSYRQGEPAMHWTCDGSPEYIMEETVKDDRGTDIVLHIDEENAEFLDDARIRELLSKYCKFLPVPIAFGKKKEWKEGKEVETDEDNVVNDVNPLWMRKPTDLQDDDYKNFYRELYPMGDDPLFWIHLNVDYPFHLTGVLYFPRIKTNLDLQRNKIQLYCNQVFVTDSVEGIVPDYLTLLHGVIDSPDIPLNVSRSYLQSDGNVKKISGYITKKVAERLNDLFKKDRGQFEEKWDDVKIFIQYGMLSDEKFYERAEKFALLKNVDGKYFTFEEYRKLIEPNQTDKDGNLVYLYATHRDEQYSYIQSAKEKAYDVLFMDSPLDAHFIGQQEQKREKTRYVRVDSDTIDKLIVKTDRAQVQLTDGQREALTAMFTSQLPTIEKTDFIVTFEQMTASDRPIYITRNEFMRRMKEMSAMQGGMMSFYGEMPDSYNMVINTAHPLVERLLSEAEAATKEKIAPLADEIATAKSRRDELQAAHKDKKTDEIPSAEKEEIDTLRKKIDEAEATQKEVYKAYAADNKLVGQLTDLALLANNMLKGESLAKFVKRSVELL